MEELKVFSLFSGIGSPEKALTNLNIDYELLGYSEFEEVPSKAYAAIHNISKDLNYGDITKIDLNNLPNDIDLITHGSPCQSYSKAGKGEGGDKGSGTRSSLMWNTVEIVSLTKPKYVIWENVPNVLSKRHKHNFDQYISDLEELGYDNYHKIINARLHGIPQNRERVFVVSIKKDLNQSFMFPQEKELTVRLTDLLDQEVDEKYYISNEELDRLTYKREGNRLFIKNATKQGYLEAFHGDGVDLAYPNSETRRGRVQPQRAHTLVRNNNLGVLLGDRIRRFTPLETFRLMGFTDEDFNKVSGLGFKELDLFGLSGNSIVVNVMEDLFKELLL
ncbi:MAG: DNA (cytosine-5-)-methyltransferase [Bacillaceae bacterium]